MEHLIIKRSELIDWSEGKYLKISTDARLFPSASANWGDMESIRNDSAYSFHSESDIEEEHDEDVIDCTFYIPNFLVPNPLGWKNHSGFKSSRLINKLESEIVWIH